MKETVKHPEHYNSHPSGIEAIDIAKHHNFCIGNVIKYIWRAGLKDPDQPDKTIEDLKKAKQYLEFEIQRLEQTDQKDRTFTFDLKPCSKLNEVDLSGFNQLKAYSPHGTVTDSSKTTKPVYTCRNYKPVIKMNSCYNRKGYNE